MRLASRSDQHKRISAFASHVACQLITYGESATALVSAPLSQIVVPHPQVTPLAMVRVTADSADEHLYAPRRRSGSVHSLGGEVRRGG